MKPLALIITIIILLQSMGWGSLPAAQSASAPTAGLAVPQVIGGEASQDVMQIGGYANITMNYTKNGVAVRANCNGVLVDSEWVLTAAYCMYPQGVNLTGSPTSITVGLGCFYKPNEICSSGTLLRYGQVRQKEISARQIVVHDQLAVVNGEPAPQYGVALIRLREAAQTGAGVSVWSVATDTDNPVAESSPYIVSYGQKGLKATATATRSLTASKTAVSASKTPTAITKTATRSVTTSATVIPEGIKTEVLLKASMSLVSDGACTLPGFSGATLWCANATAQGNELCYGDTGAPLVSKVGGQLAVFGISLPKIQFGGAHNCVVGMQSALVDVTAPAIRTWIVNTIRGTSPRGLNTGLGGSAGFGGTQLLPSDDDMAQIDVSDVFAQGIRIGTTTSSVLSINANGVVALGDVKKLDAMINTATYTGAPLFFVFNADADPSLGAMTAPVGGKSSGANRVWMAKDVANKVVTITWDDVRPKTLTRTQYIGNTFQVQFRQENGNDIRVTYRYGMMQWTYSETMIGTGNKITYAQVGYVSGQSKGVGNQIHSASGKDSLLRELVSYEYVIRDGVIGPERPTVTATSTQTMTRTMTATQTPTATRTLTASMTPTASATSAITPTSTPLAQGLTDGLLAWYPLNGIRTTGSTLPVQANTIMGPAQYFDGVNDYHQTTVDLANKSFTVAVWAALGTRNGNPAYNFIVSSGNTNRISEVFGLGYHHSHAVSCSFYGDDLLVAIPPTFNFGDWHNYACTYDNSTKTRQLYVDGQLVGSDIATSPLKSNATFYVGYHSMWTHGLGSYRDVMVYNRALTATEINRIKDLTPNSVMLSEPHPASACRWVDKGGMVHEYEINQDLLTWDQAKAAAEARTRGGQPGYLATIMSATESDCIAGLSNTVLGGIASWVGGKRISSGGNFIWQGGPEKGMYIGTSVIPVGYVNWYPGEPYPGSEESLLSYPADLGWNDVSQYATFTSIIEYTYPESHTISGVAYTDTNVNSQLDSGDFRASNQTITLTADLAQPIDLVGGGNQFCARLDDGRATCWGRRGDVWRWDQQSAVPIEIDGWRDVRAVSNGINTSCALMGNGTVSCLGKNSTGAVGDGTTTDRWTPVAVSGLTNVVALNSGGGYHHCAVLANGTVKCWGDNTYAQIGDGTYDARRITPALVPGLSGVVQVSVGERHTCARKGDGTVWCWGSNDVGQLANTTIADSAVPRQIIGLSGISDVKSGAQHVCVLRSDNQVACWGHPTGINGNRSGAIVTTPTVIANTTGSVSLSVGNEQSCVAKGDGTVWCWGHVFHGEAGWVASGTTTMRRSSAVQLTSLSNIVQVALSANSGCGRRANGDMLCWGEANVGQLGDGTYQPRGIATNVRVTWQANPYAARVVKIEAAGWQKCAILTDRRVSCWGSKHPWWSANPDTTLEPGIVNGLTDVVDLHVAMGNSCALKRDGTVWCWGSLMVVDQFTNGILNTDAPQMHKQRDVIELSSGGTPSIRCLRATSGVMSCYKNDSSAISAYQLPTGNAINSDVGAVEHGHISSCYVKQSNGEVWCWGDNTYYSQLGNGVANLQTSTPQKVNGLSNIQQIANNEYASCVILADSTVSCWGQAFRIDGVNLGAATTRGASEYPTPIAIPNTTGMRKIAMGWMTCGIKFDGTVWCWGIKKWSSLFASSNAGAILEGSITPWQVIGITDAVDINTYYGVCAVLRTGETRCLGDGAPGMLGNGTNTLSWTLRPISEPWQANVNQGCEWVDWQGRRHRYESLSGNWTWSQARDLAAARTWRGNAGYLATITSPEENRCVHQLFMKQEQRAQWPGMMAGWYPRRWLGGNDAESEGTWKWMVGPEAGTTFREIQQTNNPQAGYSQFQTISDACKPNCATYPDWDYAQILFPQGTHIQRNTWNDQAASDNESGALVEYTTGTGETARAYTTTTDSQGNYTFAGLAPGVYTIQSTTHGTTSSQRVVIWADQRDVRVDFVNRNVTTSLRQTATVAAMPTNTPTSTVTVTPQPTIAGATLWEFDSLTGNSAAATTNANNSATFYCGTNYHVTMLCPSSASDNGTSYLKFNGTQFMSSQAPISETNNLVRIRFRSQAVYATPVGLYGVVENFNANGFGGHDREIYLDRGKVCSRIVRESADIICSTWRYDDGQWHVIERSYGGTNPYHRLRVDNETVLGSYTSSIFTWRRGQIIGMSGNSTWYSFFSGDIDYVITASAP